MTQQNAALVEEASAASEAMAEQARKLGEQIAFFQLDDGERTLARRAPAPAPAGRRAAASKAAQTSRPRGHQSSDKWEEF